MRAPASLLFVCGENALRSPMAEAMVKRFHGNRVYVDSVGVRAGPLDPLAVDVMKEIDIDISAHRAKRLAELDDTSFDLIVTLSPEAHHHALDWSRTHAAEVVYWPVYDPSAVEAGREARLAAYRDVRDMLRTLIDETLRDDAETA